MSKTLVVSYTPSFESNTKKLVDAYLQATADTTDIIHLDLVKDPAPLLLEKNLNTLLKRNFMGKELTPAESETLSDIDLLMRQFKEADRIVLAFPMYNFSVPASVKAWIDTIIQNGQTFKIKEEGGYEGLCQGKHALILMTTGGDYAKEPEKSMDFATPLIQTCMGFMGFMGFMGITSHVITAGGLNQYMDSVDEIVSRTQQQVTQYVKNSPLW
ncbi:MAG: NAD(P)H-dependent oxidoreductase [Oceanospirillaceae bacterium]|nr:NAD(P)H-dependent oxidoreductase [Oceanospirillaceae bacterium]